MAIFLLACLHTKDLWDGVVAKQKTLLLFFVKWDLEKRTRDKCTETERKPDLIHRFLFLFPAAVREELFFSKYTGDV